MEGLVFLLVAETLVLSAANIENQKRKALVRRWLQGDVSLEEILFLKEQDWFQRYILKLPKQAVSEYKKND